MESRKANHAVRSWPRTTLNQIKWKILFTKTGSHNSNASQSRGASNRTGSEAINHCGRGTVRCFFRRDCQQSFTSTTEEHTRRNLTRWLPASGRWGASAWQRSLVQISWLESWTRSVVSSFSIRGHRVLMENTGARAQCCWEGISVLCKLYQAFYLPIYHTSWEMGM